MFSLLVGVHYIRCLGFLACGSTLWISCAAPLTGETFVVFCLFVCDFVWEAVVCCATGVHHLNTLPSTSRLSCQASARVMPSFSQTAALHYHYFRYFSLVRVLPQFIPGVSDYWDLWVCHSLGRSTILPVTDSPAELFLFLLFSFLKMRKKLKRLFEYRMWNLIPNHR